ncbi:TPA: ABC transporter permease [Staphylococcus aureus]
MKILAIVRRVLKEMLRDKRTLALMFLAPILILTLMYFIFNGDENDLKIGIDTSVSSNITKQLPSSDIKTQTFHSHENIKSKIENNHLDGYIYQENQTLIIVLFSIYLLNINLAGSLWYVILINICLAITALSMGIFISTFANSEFQMIQFIPLVAVPQVFFSGIFPLENMPDWLGNIGYIFPLRYAGDALTNVMIKGQGWSNIWFDLLILMIFIIVFIILNIVGLKRYRQV